MINFFTIFFIGIFLSSCSDVLRRDSFHPHKDVREIKKMVEPIDQQPHFYAPSKRQQKQKEVISKKLLKPVTVSLSGKTPLKDMLFSLAEQAGVELQLDPSIVDIEVIYTAHKKPFYHVVRNICKLAKLRFMRIEDSIKIEPNTPYSKNYNLQALNIERYAQNRISTATDVFSSVDIAGGQGKGGDNSSNSEVKMSMKNSFWDEFENNLKTILKSEFEPDINYAIHRQAGLISIHAKQEQHELVEDYIQKLKHVISRQVLIEAKIVEVNLKDNFRSGIDWKNFNQLTDFQLGAEFASLSKQPVFSDANFPNKNPFSIGWGGNQFSGILKALEEFGSARTISSPRLTVMNNQVAILKVAQNKVYFKLNYDKQFSTANNFQNFSISSDIKTVPIGLVMSVQPSIDEETDDIVLCLRPTISKLGTPEYDPAVSIALANAQGGNAQNIDPKVSSVPVVDVKEIDSVLRVKSGEIAILGGLMEVRNMKDNSGVPGLKDVPLAKDLFSAQNDTGEVVEVVIIFKATIVDQPTIHAADKRLLNEYVVDTRKIV